MIPLPGPEERLRRRRPSLDAGEPRHRPVTALVLVAGTAAALAVAVLAVPRGGPLPAIARYAMAVALPGWHTTEPVNEIVYGTRGFDTFGETFLLLAAVVSISMFTRGRQRRGGFVGESVAGRREQHRLDPDTVQTDSERTARAAEQAEQDGQGEDGGPGEHWDGGGDLPADPDAEPLGFRGAERARAMTVVVRGATRALAPILIVAGVYLMAWGYSPGGGFPAGAVLLGVVLLGYVSLGPRRLRRVLRPEVVEPIEIAGAIAIIVTGLLGLALRGSFSANFLPLGPVRSIRSGGVLQVFSVSEFVEVGTGLILAVFGLIRMGHTWSRDEDRSAAKVADSAAAGRPDRARQPRGAPETEEEP